MRERLLTGLGFLVGLLIAGVCIHSGTQSAGDHPEPPASGLFTGP
jgi:hypothetical protein